MAAIIISIVVALTGIIVALSGAWAISEWRRESVGRRQVELCEEVLAAAYEFREIMKWVRSPGGFADEGQSREPPPEAEDVETQQQRNFYYITIERLGRDSEKISKLISFQYRFMAYFGAAAGEPFQAFNRQSSRVHSAALALMQHASGPRRHALTRERIDKWEAVIRADWNEYPDVIQPKINNAIAELETICRPVLMGSRPMDILDFTLIRPAWQSVMRQVRPGKAVEDITGKSPKPHA